MNTGTLNVKNQEALEPAHCPYLALHDDETTALAYPSPWNYCYRARPPASVHVTHQSETCLSARYTECPLLQTEKRRRLPRHLRGKMAIPYGGRSLEDTLARLALLVLLVLVVSFLLLLARQYFIS